MIQWHPAFCSAVRLELRENKNDLLYEEEYNLGRKLIQINLLVIRKTDRTHISKNIGRIFREHNVMEYKSPEDAVQDIGMDKEKFLSEMRDADIRLPFRLKKSGRPG